MKTAIFPHSEALERIVAHASKPGGLLYFVHDQGLYLMSPGLLRDDNPEGQTNHLCAYAEGCDPERDGEWWDNARAIVGGDDFGEDIDTLGIAKMMEGGAGLRFEVSETHINITSAAR
jgi:hypothetical protein